MDINRHNYEEFFLLYVDNELTPEQRQGVDQFLQENPDLNGELELFRQTSLLADQDIVFEGKETLLKNATLHLHSGNYEEYLVAYVDNELNSSERKKVEDFLATHPAVAEELKIFRQTKLQADPLVLCPDKESLYRSTEKVRVISLQWWKIAVAAAVILAIGITTLTIMNKPAITVQGIAATKKSGTQPAPEKITEPAEKIGKEEPVITSPTENNSAQIAAVPRNGLKTKDRPKSGLHEGQIITTTHESYNKAVIADVKQPPADKTVAQKPADTKTNLPVNETQLNNDQQSQTIAITHPSAQQNINNGNVTKELNKPSDNKETAQEGTTDIGAVAASYNEEGKNKKLRGFFRKASRIFEKRANISSADDDDKVLIGVLAVKLK